MNQKTKLSYSLAIFSALVFGFASLAAIAKSDNGNSDSDKLSRDSQQKTKSKSINLRNFKKPNPAKAESHAELHKEKTIEVARELERVANQEKVVGNIENSKQIEEVAKEQEASQEETTEAIEEVESRNKVKTFLVGTDYKNLGQLRSFLVKNRNQIRKLTQTTSQLQTAGDATAISAQLESLMQERTRIREIIEKNEEGFSLFGWVSRFLSSYEETPIDEAEENELAEEVEEAINDAVNIIPATINDATPDATSDTTTDTTAPTAPGSAADTGSTTSTNTTPQETTPTVTIP